MDVLTLTPEVGVRADVDLDQGVAGRAAERARLALALEPEHLAAFGAGRNLDLDRAAVIELQALAAAARRDLELDLEPIAAIGAAQLLAGRAAAGPCLGAQRLLEAGASPPLGGVGAPVAAGARRAAGEPAPERAAEHLLEQALRGVPAVVGARVGEAAEAEIAARGRPSTSISPRSKRARLAGSDSSW